MTKTRTETDTFGPIEVPADRYWGAQTQRSLQNFKIGGERHAAPVVHALGVVKRAAADRQCRARPARHEARRCHRGGGAGSDRRQARRAFPAGRLADGLGHAVEHERERGDLEPRHRDAGRRDGLEEAGASQRPRQPQPVVERHLPDGDAHRGGERDRTHVCCRRLKHLHAALERQDQAFADIIKIGRTHMQDATPLTLGQEFSGYATQVAYGIARVEAALPRLCSWRRAARRSAPASTPARLRASVSRKKRPRSPGLPFVTAPNKFEALAAHDAVVEMSRRAQHGRRVAVQDRQDIRLLGSGPRSGLGELSAAGKRAGLVDHAGQGQPDAVRGADAWSARR